MGIKILSVPSSLHSCLELHYPATLAAWRALNSTTDEQKSGHTAEEKLTQGLGKK